MVKSVKEHIAEKTAEKKENEANKPNLFERASKSIQHKIDAREARNAELKQALSNLQQVCRDAAPLVDGARPWHAKKFYEHFQSERLDRGRIKKSSISKDISLVYQFKNKEGNSLNLRSPNLRYEISPYGPAKDNKYSFRSLNYVPRITQHYNGTSLKAHWSVNQNDKLDNITKEEVLETLAKHAANDYDHNHKNKASNIAKKIITGAVLVGLMHAADYLAHNDNSPEPPENRREEIRQWLNND